MPTILQINVACNWGSTGRIAEQIGQIAQKRNWTCYLAHSSRYRNTSCLNTIIVSSSIEEKFHAVESFLFDNCGEGSKMGTYCLIKKIKKIKPDIIHLHNIHGYFINYKLLFEYLSKANIPIIWTLHDCWSFTGHCAYFDRVGCERWKECCYGCPQKNKYPKALIDNSRLNYLKKKKAFTSLQKMVIVPVSQWLGDFVSESFLSKYPIKVIHNGVDLTVFKPQNNNKIRIKLGYCNKFVILGVASGFDERKGLSDFIKLSSIIPDEWQIVLIGINPKDFSKIPNKINAIGKTNSIEQLVSFYSMADVFLNLTYEDNFPTTNLEALSSGTPVVTYRTGGSPEAIDENTGFVVEKGNLEEVVLAIDKIRKNGKNFYINACRKRSEMNFNKDDRYMDYISLYDNLINEK